MRSTFAFVPSSGRLQRAAVPAAAMYLGSLVAVALLSDNPLVIAGAGAAALVAGLAAGARRALKGAARMGLTLGLMLALLNALFAGRGETILIRIADFDWPGRVDLTLEGLFSGAILGLRVFVVLLLFAVWSAAVDPDRVMRVLRPVAWRSALTVGVALRLVPVAASDASRIRQASALRGPGASKVGVAAAARRLLSGSLERAVDVAATLELRGYDLDRKPAGGPGWRSRASVRDGRFVAAGAGAIALAVVLRLAGLSDTEAFPKIDVALGPAVWIAALALPLLAWIPFARLPEAHSRA